MVRRHILILIAVSALSMLLWAPAATAKKKKKAPKPTPVTKVTVSDTTTADNEPVDLVASCPAGTIVVGGGFISSSFPNPGLVQDLNIVYDSRRLSPTSWHLGAVREDSGPAGNALTITAEAYCRTPKLKSKPKAKKKKKLALTEVSAVGPAVGSGVISSATASCSGKQRPISGGFSSSPPPTLSGGLSFPFVFANFRSSATGWTASLTNSGATPRTVTSFAYCSAVARTSEVTGTAALPGSTGAGNAHASATTNRCPKTRNVVAGGFSHTAPAVGTAIPIITESTIVGKTVKESAFNFTPTPGTLGSHGYCL